VAAFRHVLVEMDEKTKDEQWTILKESKLPLSVVIDSGGKSLHGWVRVDAANKEEWNERRDVVYRQLETLGIDPKNKNASRFSRLAGVMRDGNEQKLLAINVGSVNWDASLRRPERLRQKLNGCVPRNEVGIRRSMVRRQTCARAQGGLHPS
jgi:RecA-family ATPase